MSECNSGQGWTNEWRATPQKYRFASTTGVLREADKGLPVLREGLVECTKCGDMSTATELTKTMIFPVCQICCATLKRY